MNRKLTPAVEASEAPRRARVRVQEPELLRKHSLTLIGKVTNRSVQKVPSLIPFFTEYWKKQEMIRTVGSDLGQGLFQFQFDSESDLLTILENRPYHFAKWMVILQRWEPTISHSFPSLIPFWIKIEGIPAHLCTEETIRSIGEDIGHFESSDISSSLRMRVHVNGRLPLIKSSVIEYPNGDEVTASLVYERLEKHCSHCYRLDHELKDCLAAKHLKKKKALSIQQHKEEQSSSCGNNSVVTTEKSSHPGPSRYDHLQTRRSSYNSNSIKWVPKDDQRRDSSRQDESVPSHGDHLAGEDKARKLSANGEVSSSSKGDVREVMVQYSSCTDPLESAACNERQEQGQLEKTGAQIVRAALSKQQLLDTPQAGVSLTPEFVATLVTSQPESRQTMMSGTSTTVPLSNGGDAPVHDYASDQSFQLYLYNADSQLSPPPPSPRYYSSGGMIRGNMQYQGQGEGQGQSSNMPQNNHPVFQPMRQQYQPEASIPNQNYGPVSSYQQANYYHGLTTKQAHHILDPSRFPAAMQPPAPDKANLELQRQAAQLLQPMLSGLGDVEKDERYQRTLQFAASLLHQIK